MTREVKALLVFCEGPHDAAFVRQVVQYCFDFRRVEWKFSEFPAPFNQLFRSSVERHAASDLSLDMAHKFFLPDRVMVKDDHVLLIFNSGGSSNADRLKTFLADFLTLLSQAAVFPHDAPTVISQTRYLFLYDADHLGVERIRSQTSLKFAEIDGSPWLQDHWITVKGNPYAAFTGDKAVYVWGGTEERGTLEDILLPMFEQSQPVRINKAASAVDGIFTWEVDSANVKQAVAEGAKRKKSIITVAGQREKPGMSMNVILDQAGLIDKDSFTADTEVVRFSVFLGNFIGLQFE